MINVALKITFLISTSETNTHKKTGKKNLPKQMDENYTMHCCIDSGTLAHVRICIPIHCCILPLLHIFYVHVHHVPLTIIGIDTLSTHAHTHTHPQSTHDEIRLLLLFCIISLSFIVDVLHFFLSFRLPHEFKIARAVTVFPSTRRKPWYCCCSTCACD